MKKLIVFTQMLVVGYLGFAQSFSDQVTLTRSLEKKVFQFKYAPEESSAKYTFYYSKTNTEVVLDQSIKGGFIPGTRFKKILKVHAPDGSVFFICASWYPFGHTVAIFNQVNVLVYRRTTPELAVGPKSDLFANVRLTESHNFLFVEKARLAEGQVKFDNQGQYDLNIESTVSDKYAAYLGEESTQPTPVDLSIRDKPNSASGVIGTIPIGTSIKITHMKLSMPLSEISESTIRNGDIWILVNDGKGKSGWALVEYDSGRDGYEVQPSNVQAFSYAETSGP